MTKRITELQEQIKGLKDTNQEKIKAIQEQIRKIKEYNKEYNRKYYYAKRKAQRQEASKIKQASKEATATCIICGKKFVPYNSTTKCCSEECREIYKAQYQKQYRASEEFKEKEKNYRQSEAYKEVRARYAKSKKGKASLKRYYKKFKANGYKPLGTTVKAELESKSEE